MKILEIIADFFSCSVGTVLRRTGQLGLKEKRETFLDESIRELIEQGKNYSEISRELSVPRSRVKTRCQEMGITTEYLTRISVPLDEKEVLRLYVDERLSINQIMKK